MAVPVIPDKLYFKIGEVSELVGVKPYVLRYWESEFKEISPVKSSANQRLYRCKDVEILSKIRQLLYRERYTISGAKKILKQELSPASAVAASSEQLDFSLGNAERITTDAKAEVVDGLKGILREMQETLKKMS